MPIRNRIVGLQFVKAGALIPHPQNWRRHPEKQRQALQSMLDAVGYADAVIARETPDGLVLVDGHLRADLDPDQEVPVLVTDLDEMEAGQVLATLDPLSAMAETDQAALDALVRDLSAQADDSMAALLRDFHGVVVPDIQTNLRPKGQIMDPASDVEHVAKRGDIWQLGRHRVMCGDCTDPMDVGLLLDGVQVDCILTDPPYSSGGFQESGKLAGSKGSDAAYVPITNDRLSTRGYMALMRQVLTHRQAPVLYVFTDWRMWVNLFDVVESSGYGVRSMIVWNKEAPGMGSGWRAQHELVMCGTREAGLWKDRHAPAVGNVISLPRAGNVHHVTEKPVALLSVILGNTPNTQAVFDPFVGGGSTIIAAEGQSQTAYGMDLEPRYVDICLARWKTYTGEAPTLAV